MKTLFIFAEQVNEAGPSKRPTREGLLGSWGGGFEERISPTDVGPTPAGVGFWARNSTLEPAVMSSGLAPVVAVVRVFRPHCSM